MTGALIGFAGCFLAIFMPETLSKVEQETLITNESEYLSDAAVDTSTHKGYTIVDISVREVRDMIGSIMPLWKNVNIMLCLAVFFFFASINKECTGLLIQYTSLKFERSLAWVSETSIKYKANG